MSSILDATIAAAEDALRKSAEGGFVRSFKIGETEYEFTSPSAIHDLIRNLKAQKVATATGSSGIRFGVASFAVDE